MKNTRNYEEININIYNSIIWIKIYPNGNIFLYNLIQVGT